MQPKISFFVFIVSYTLVNYDENKCKNQMSLVRHFLNESISTHALNSFIFTFFGIRGPKKNSGEKK